MALSRASTAGADARSRITSEFLGNEVRHTRGTRHAPPGEFFRKGKNGTEQWTQYLKQNAKVNAFSAILKMQLS
jgi:hypothetical protein